MNDVVVYNSFHAFFAWKIVWIWILSFIKNSFLGKWTILRFEKHWRKKFFRLFRLSTKFECKRQRTNWIINFNALHANLLGILSFTCAYTHKTQAVCFLIFIRTDQNLDKKKAFVPVNNRIDLVTLSCEKKQFGGLSCLLLLDIVGIKSFKIFKDILPIRLDLLFNEPETIIYETFNQTEFESYIKSFKFSSFRWRWKLKCGAKRHTDKAQPHKICESRQHDLYFFTFPHSDFNRIKCIFNFKSREAIEKM